MNLSRFSQCGRARSFAFLPAACRWKFSARILFPPIKKSPYFAHAWPAFVITGSSCSRKANVERAAKKRVVPTIDAPRRTWKRCWTDGQRAQIEREILPDYIRDLPLVRREGAHASRNAHARTDPDFVRGRTPRNFGSSKSVISTARPKPTRCRCKIASGETAEAHRRNLRRMPSSRDSGVTDAILYDAVWDAAFREKLFRLMLDRQRANGRNRQTGRRAESAGRPDRRSFRLRRFSAPSKAIRRCFSRTNSSSSFIENSKTA